ncbi:MAG: hypothetical protein J5I65_14920 [Aridibacter famidurans]|nr:hypothetical protein [Aridibacter famidurans]
MSPMLFETESEAAGHTASRLSASALGIYLVVISMLQMTRYAYLLSGWAGESNWLIYEVLDPRVFWNIIDHSFRGYELNQLGLVGLLSCIWLLAIGISFVLGRLPLVTYITSEILLGTPQVLLSIPWGLLMISEGEGVLTSIAPISLAFLFTLIPIPWALYLAIQIRSEKHN